MVKFVLSFLLSGVMITINAVIIRYITNCDLCIYKFLEAIPWYVLTLISPAGLVLISVVLIVDAALVLAPCFVFAIALDGGFSD